MTPSVSTSLPFSERTTNRFFVISETPSLPAAAYSDGRPAVRSFVDSVGLWMNVASSGVALTADWIAFSSVWTLVNTWGDLLSAAEKTALEYFCAMVLAARRPRPAERAAERAEAANMAVEGDEGSEGRCARRRK